MCSTSATFAVALELMRFQLLRENERVRSSNSKIFFFPMFDTRAAEIHLSSCQLLFFKTSQMLASHLL